MSRQQPTVRGPLVAEQFLMLPENKVAYTAIVAAINPQTSTAGRQRSVYLYGPPGVGKTHLARLAATLASREKSPPKVKLLQAAEFVADLVDASAARNISRFQASLTDADLVIVEDVQALERRPESQQQLLAYLEDRLTSGALVIWTSTRLPGELQEMSAKLVARFRGGTLALMRLPGPESREQLITHFAARQQVVLPPTVVSRLVRSAAQSPRELQAMVQMLVTLSHRERRDIDLHLTAQVLKNDTPLPKLTAADIARCVANEFGLSVAALRAPTRKQAIVRPRQCAMLLTRELTDLGLLEIGAFYGKQDHTTVLHACSRIAKLLEEDAQLRSQLGHVRRLLRSESRTTTRTVRQSGGTKPAGTKPEETKSAGPKPRGPKPRESNPDGKSASRKRPTSGDE